MRNPLVVEMLRKLHEIHNSKNDDYASSDPYENFIRSAQVAEWFNDDRDKPYAVLIATKLARLATLLSKDGPPNNESIEDTFDDLALYSILWATYRKRLKAAFRQLTVDDSAKDS